MCKESSIHKVFLPRSGLVLPKAELPDCIHEVIDKRSPVFKTLTCGIYEYTPYSLTKGMFTFLVNVSRTGRRATFRRIQRDTAHANNYIAEYMKSASDSELSDGIYSPKRVRAVAIVGRSEIEDDALLVGLITTAPLIRELPIAVHYFDLKDRRVKSL